LAATGILVGGLSRVKIGGHINGWIFAFGGLALVVGLLPGDLRRWAHRGRGREGLARVLHILVWVAGVGGLGIRLEASWIGHAATLERDEVLARRYQNLVASMDGPVLAPIFPAVTELAGGGPQISMMPIWDLAYGHLKIPIQGLRERIQERHWSAVFLPRDDAVWFPGLEKAYFPAYPLELPAMQSGNHIALHWVWLPRRPEYQPAGFHEERLLGRRIPGGHRITAPFLIRSGTLHILVVGGGDPRYESLGLRVGTLIQRRYSGIPGSPPRWIHWDISNWIGDRAVLRLRTEDPSSQADLRVLRVIFGDLPPNLRELLKE
jgi:hypothetical protein